MQTFSNFVKELKKEPATAQTEQQPEQSGLACLMRAIDFRRIELLPEYGAGYTARIYDEESEPVAEAVGHTAAEAIRAALSAQGRPRNK